MPGANRYFCGRVHRRPALIRFLDSLGYHKELYRVVGELQVRIRWVRAKKPGRSIYSCRKPMTHWKATIKPPGLRWVDSVHDRNFSPPGLDAAKNVENRRTPYWRARIEKPTREVQRIQIPTDAWEIGHKYEFTRWEDTG